MKRYYIVPKNVFHEIDPANNMPRHAWLAGSSCVELPAVQNEADPGSPAGASSAGVVHLLVCTDFAKDHHADRWHDHPEVARLTHPQLEQAVPLAHLHQKPEHAHKQFKAHHFDKLQKLCAQHGFTLSPSHTLWDLHDALTSHYPGIRLTRY